MYIATNTPRLVLNKILQRKLSVKQDMLTQAVSQGLRKALKATNAQQMRNSAKINFYKVTQADYKLLTDSSTATFLAITNCAVNIVATLNAAQTKQAIATCTAQKLLTKLQYAKTFTAQANTSLHQAYKTDYYATVARNTDMYATKLAHLLK